LNIAVDHSRVNSAAVEDWTCDPEIKALTIPDYQSLMLPVLKSAAASERRIPDIEDMIAKEYSLNDAEREALLPSGKQRILHNRLHWAKFYMAKAGLLELPRRGYFIASETGRALLATQPERIDVNTLLRYPAFREFYKSSESLDSEAGLGRGSVAPATAEPPTPAKTPEEQIETAHTALQSALSTEILDRILQNSPSFFEQLIVNLLVSMNYGGSHKDAAQQLGRTGDGGVDGVINEDRLGLDRVYVQAKRYASENKIGRQDVQAFVGSLVGLGASKGVFVTTSSFSPGAKEFVRHLAQRVILIEGSQLAELMIEHNVGVRIYKEIQFKRLDEDFFSEDS
jgi:restriction system protein